TPVEKKEKEQWMLAITKYAERLDKDLDTVDFQERIKIQQRNWIGKSEGAEIDFRLDFKKNPADNDRRGPDGKPAQIKVFTTRPDTIYGATYLVLSPEHLWVTLATDKDHDVLENKDEVRAYLTEVKKKSEIERTAEGKEKTGVELKGVKAINPATKEEISMFVADYVLAHYGTGAIMAVPAHDERDGEFAKKFNLPVKEVVQSMTVKTEGTDAIRAGSPLIERNAAMCLIKHWSEDKYLCSKWKTNDWQGFVIGGIEEGETEATAAVREVTEETGYTNVEYKKTLGTVHSQFWHDVKKQNRFAHFKVVYLELKNGDQKPVSESEQKLHTVEWVSKDRVHDFVNRVDLKAAWDMLSTDFRYTGDGLLVNSGAFSGKHSADVRKEITESVGGKIVTTFKLRDWIFSRQRYWGEPIPVVHCKQHGVVAVPEKDLPVKLPLVKNYQPTQTGESPLAAIEKWVNTKCPQCKGPAKRETDTMPNWAGSSWYYLRYTDPKNSKAFAGTKNLKYWTPVDWYNGGMEHTTLHLLYSRFWHKFLFDQGLVPTAEPYQKRTSHGLILAEGGAKMSKSVGNVINPDGIVKTFGADALRLYEMFMGPFEQHIAWDTNGIVGTRRFVEKVWRLGEKVEGLKGWKKEKNAPSIPQPLNPSSLTKTLHKTIKKVTEDIESMGFNTAISTLMITVNEMEKSPSITREQYQILLQLIAPFAPHVAEELWSLQGNKKSIHLSQWPQFDPSLVIDTEATIVVQVNGKTRSSFVATLNSSKEFLEKTAQELPEIKKWTEGKSVIKVVVVPGRLINIVIKDGP
ncbi:MAG: class I tRNA ligase family protein, partial [Patescibacteria group bacterium]